MDNIKNIKKVWLNSLCFLDNSIINSIIVIILVLYSSAIFENINYFIANIYNFSLIRLIILLFIIYIAPKDITIAILLAISYVISMHYRLSTENFENNKEKGFLKPPEFHQPPIGFHPNNVDSMKESFMSELNHKDDSDKKRMHSGFHQPPIGVHPGFHQPPIGVHPNENRSGSERESFMSETNYKDDSDKRKMNTGFRKPPIGVHEPNLDPMNKGTNKNNELYPMDKKKNMQNKEINEKFFNFNQNNDPELNVIITPNRNMNCGNKNSNSNSNSNCNSNNNNNSNSNYLNESSCMEMYDPKFEAVNNVCTPVATYKNEFNAQGLNFPEGFDSPYLGSPL